VKYRHPLLTPKIEARLKEICHEIAKDKEFIVYKLEVGEQDNVHVFVSGHPKISPSYMAKMLKGISARKLFVEYPELKKKCWKGRLWNGSYYIETIGSTSEENIKNYINRQKKGEVVDGDQDI